MTRVSVGTESVSHEDVPSEDEVRRTWFCAKTDIGCDDHRLSQLRNTATEDAAGRTPAVARAVRSLLGLRLFRVTPAPRQGTFHLVHFVTGNMPPLVVRSNRVEVMGRSHALHMEVTIGPELARAGVPHAVVHAVATGRNRAAPFDLAIQETAPGSALCDLPDAAHECPDVLRNAGGVLRDVHRIEGTGGGPVGLKPYPAARLSGLHRQWRDYMMLNLGAHVATCRDIGVIGMDQSDAILRVFTDHAAVWDGLPMRLLHGDLGNGNLFVKDRTVVGLIDWEDALIGDPAFDVAMWCSFHPPRRYAPFLKGYGRIASDDRFRLRLALSFLRIALSKTVHRHRFGYQDLPGREPAHDRIARGVVAVERALGGAQEVISNGMAGEEGFPQPDYAEHIGLPSSPVDL